ncbi:hypothetical protein [Bradyrhizobium jicamae]|nr:hypothetical protein [Bradyrhizobium jicamae]
MFDQLVKRAVKFEQAAHKLLSMHEGAASRVVDARQSLARVTALSIKQEDMVKQAVRCIEVEVFRAAHVLAFAAFIDYLHELAGRDDFVALNAARDKWNIASVEDIRERFSDHNFIEGLEAAKLITKAEKKAFQGLLTRRNECAHPSDFYPDMNQSLGYVSEALSRIEALKSRYP